MMGDLNAKIGPFGLGERNERGERMAEWCDGSGQVVTNTWFRHHPRYLWTWKSPGDRYRNQIDYITINKRFRNSITQVRTYPGADCGSDHVPLVATMRLKLKKLKRTKVKPKKDLSTLSKEGVLRDSYGVQVRNRFDALQCEDCAEAKWSRMQEALSGATEQVVPNIQRKMKQKWMNEDILEKMNNRRLKKNNTVEYKRIDREIREDCSRAKEEWLNEKCGEVEELERVDKRLMYSKINEITGGSRNRTGGAIKKSNGDIAVESLEVKQRWQEYITELFDDDRNSFVMSEEKEFDGPPIMEREVEDAIKT